MKTQGHGDHWESITTSDELVETHLPNLLQEGLLEDKTEVNAIFFEDGICCKKTVFSLALKEDFSQLALIVTNDKRNTNELITAYPFIRNGARLPVTITHIHEWEQKYEAVIEAETSDGFTISFFDTKYYLNKEKYVVGNSYTFALSCLAYMAEILKEEDRTFSFDGQQATEWLAKTGESPTMDENGNVEPVRLSMSKLVAFLQMQEPYDNAEFQSPIESIEKIAALDTDFYKFRICIFLDSAEDTSFHLDLYAKASFFEVEPKEGDPLRGVAWTQGYLVEE